MQKSAMYIVPPAMTCAFPSTASLPITFAVSSQLQYLAVRPNGYNYFTTDQQETNHQNWIANPATSDSKTSSTFTATKSQKQQRGLRCSKSSARKNSRGQKSMHLNFSNPKTSISKQNIGSSGDRLVNSGPVVGQPPPEKLLRRRVSANKKERRRTMSINGAFSQLRSKIPNVPNDTKLSKIKTLRLASSYIAYLTAVLDSDEQQQQQDRSTAMPIDGGFQAVIANVLRAQEDTRRRMRRSACRTGWPQHVWAGELNKSSGTAHQRPKLSLPTSFVRPDDKKVISKTKTQTKVNCSSASQQKFDNAFLWKAEPYSPPQAAQV